MNDQKMIKSQKAMKKEGVKPQYFKPEVVATYSEQDLEKEFANAYGATFVDLFG